MQLNKFIPGGWREPDGRGERRDHSGRQLLSLSASVFEASFGSAQTGSAVCGWLYSAVRHTVWKHIDVVSSLRSEPPAACGAPSVQSRLF